MEDFINLFYNNLLNKNNLSNDRTFYRYFETFVLKLIESILEKENKPLIKYPKEEFLNNDNNISFYEFDAIAPEGINGIKGPTLIEIKSSLSTKSIQNIARIHRRNNKEFNSYLIIIGTPLDNSDRNFLKKTFDFKIYNNENQVEIWDLEKIVELASNSNDISKRILNNIENEVFNLTIENARNSSDDWTKERDVRLEKLKQAYKNDEIVLMVGAGASKDAGVPDWSELLKDLNLSIIDQKISAKLTSKEKSELADSLVGMQNGTPLVSASYIKNALGNEFVKEIKNSLYKHVKPIKDQRLLEVIAQLSRPKRKRVGIDAIITYNFDDLLEVQLNKNGVEYKSIYREGDFEIPTKLSVYHVHGFIPKKPEEYKNLEQALLVFSEEGYHELQIDPYSWSNIVQMKALREKTCVLVGLSGLDPNLRRLFSIHAKRFDGCKHYIILERQFKDEMISKSSKFQEFSKLHHTIQEDTFKEIGLNVIWYSEHTEIPGLLEKLDK